MDDANEPDVTPDFDTDGQSEGRFGTDLRRLGPGRR